jgi:uncharacterized membrane protein
MTSIITRLRDTHRLPIVLVFFLTTVICVTLVAFRVHYTSQVTFVFLVWNIFLALIPYMISTVLVLYHEVIEKKWIIWIPFVVWLCFFPNAPYILTDLFHLRRRSDIPHWYDLGLILFFAWNGLMLGYASLMDMQTVIAKRFNAGIGWTITVGSLLLAGFGIYLGRYLRWNSWDVISSPEGLLHDIFTRLSDPFAHPRTFGVTFLFSTFLVLGYVLLLQFSKVYNRPRS